MVNIFSSFFWLPGRCILCRQRSRRDMDLCPDCEGQLPLNRCSCHRCGMPMAIAADACGDCLQQPPPWHRCCSLLAYRDAALPLIHRLKYRQDLPVVRVLGELLVNTLVDAYRDDEWPQLLLPVPLHWRRLHRRGYNQSGLLARLLGHRLDIPVSHSRLARARPTPPQQGLDRAQRQRNIRGAFLVRRGPEAVAGVGVALEEPGRFDSGSATPTPAASNPWSHVALVDDVVTTGATVGELARLLLDSGATRVDVWCLARTP